MKYELSSAQAVWIRDRLPDVYTKLTDRTCLYNRQARAFYVAWRVNHWDLWSARGSWIATRIFDRAMQDDNFIDAMEALLTLDGQIDPGILADKCVELLLT